MAMPRRRWRVQHRSADEGRVWRGLMGLAKGVRCLCGGLVVSGAPHRASLPIHGRCEPYHSTTSAEIACVSSTILVPEGTKMSALTVQVLRLSLSLGSVTAVNLRRSVCGAQGSLDR